MLDNNSGRDGELGKFKIWIGGEDNFLAWMNAYNRALGDKPINLLRAGEFDRFVNYIKKYMQK